MFPTLLHLQKQFYTVFAGGDYKTPVSLPGVGVDVPVISSRLSSDDYAEAKRENYPLISIQEMEPRFSDRFNNDFMNYEVVGKTPVDAEYLNEVVPHKPVFKRSFFMEMPFDVHFVSKRAKETHAFRQLMLTAFGKMGYLTFDGYPDYEIIDENSVPHKEVVEYTVERVVVDRADGVRQEVFQFVILAWISSGDPELVPLVSDLNIDLSITQQITR